MLIRSAPGSGLQRGESGDGTPPRDSRRRTSIGTRREIGSLEVGKSADLAAFPLDAVGPVHDPITTTVFALPGTRASFVAVGGRELVRDGALVAQDPLLEGASASGGRLAAAMVARELS